MNGNKNKNYMLLLDDARGPLPGVKCRQVSLGVVLLTCYAGPTVGAGGRFSPTCGAKI